MFPFPASRVIITKRLMGIFGGGVRIQNFPVSICIMPDLWDFVNNLHRNSDTPEYSRNLLTEFKWKDIRISP